MQIYDQMIRYCDNNKIPHRNLTQEKALCLTGNGPKSQCKLINLHAYVNEALLFKPSEHRKNWRLIATEQGVYDRVFNVVHPFVGPHPKK